MTITALVPRELAEIIHHDSSYWTCAASRLPLDGCLLFHNQDLVPRIDPNHAVQFRLDPSRAERVLSQVIEFYQRLGAIPAAYVDCNASPPNIIPLLFEAGFQPWDGADSDLMMYTGHVQPVPTPYPLLRVKTDQDREAWASITDVDEPDQQALLCRLYLTQLSDPRLVAYLVCVNGEPAARCLLFSQAGIGRVEAVHTRVKFRRQGLASALVACAARESQQLNRLTYLVAEPGGKPQQLYLRLGFKNVVRHFIRSFLFSSLNGDRQ